MQSWFVPRQLCGDIAQLGEQQTEVLVCVQSLLEVPGSIPGVPIFL